MNANTHLPKIYLASPFFSEKELAYVEKAEKFFREKGYPLFSPREHTVDDVEAGSRQWAERIFRIDREGIEDADLVVVLMHGGYGDTGTAWECGYACAKGKPVVVVHTEQNANLMVTEGSTSNIWFEEMDTYDWEHLEQRPYEGKVF